MHLSVATSCYFSLAAHTVTSAELVELQWKCPGDLLSCCDGLYMGEVTPGNADHPAKCWEILESEPPTKGFLLAIICN